MDLQTQEDKEYVLLRQELTEVMEHINDERDVQKIRSIVEKMEEIHPEREEEYKSTDEYWQYFKENYLQDAFQTAELIRNHNGGKEKKKKVRIQILRFASVFLFLLFTISTTMAVFADINLFAPIVTWTKELFIKKGTTELIDDVDSNDISSLESLELKLNLILYKPDTEKLGYTITNFTVNDLSGWIVVATNYQCDDIKIEYIISIYETPHNYVETIEKTDESVMIYKKDIEYYIIQNENWYVVTWQDTNIDYTATGFRDKDSALQFIDYLRK